MKFYTVRHMTWTLSELEDSYITHSSSTAALMEA